MDFTFLGLIVAETLIICGVRDAIFATFIAVVQSVMAYLAWDVAVNPTDLERRRRTYRLAFVACAVLTTLLAGYSTYRNTSQAAATEVRTAAIEARAAELSNTLGVIHQQAAEIVQSIQAPRLRETPQFNVPVSSPGRPDLREIKVVAEGFNQFTQSIGSVLILANKGDESALDVRSVALAQFGSNDPDSKREILNLWNQVKQAEMAEGGRIETGRAVQVSISTPMLTEQQILKLQQRRSRVYLITLVRYRDNNGQNYFANRCVYVSGNLTQTVGCGVPLN